MPNVLDAAGLQVATVPEITANLQAGFQSVYGADINVDSNSPDGQIIGIFAQNSSDILRLLVQVYNSFSPDSAFGVTLDSRVAISGVARKKGTYTLAIVAVTTTQALNLLGAGTDPANPVANAFSVADNAGNQYVLVTSYAFGRATTTSLTFRSLVIGQIQTTPTTIQTIVTTQTGVSGVNNPTVAGDTEGLPEETDPQLKIRRAASYYLQAQGPADSLRAALINTADISDAYVVQNDTSGVVDGVPAYSLWIIVAGGTAAEIAQVIYTKKAPGCPMKGAVTYNVVRPQGNTFTAAWDAAIAQPLYIRATLTPRIAGQTFDVVADGIALAAALIYKLGQSPNIGDVVLAMQTIEPGAILSVVNVSTDGATWENIVSSSDAQHYFSVIAANVVLS